MTPRKYLTKKQVIEKVNRTPNLKRKLKIGSWETVSLKAGVYPASDEPIPTNKLIRRLLYLPGSVRQIVEKIGTARR